MGDLKSIMLTFGSPSFLFFKWDIIILLDTERDSKWLIDNN